MEQLRVCVDYEVDYIITSLGSPKPVIDVCKPKGIKVFCDVVDENYAKKVEDLGAEALIAVNSKAGGHSGPTTANHLIPKLNEVCDIPVISAGGIGNGTGVKKMLDLGACGLSIGTLFIACKEAQISQEYKQAIIDHGADDIVMTTKLSGSPCTVINTPFVQEIGTRQSWIESILNKNKKLKKYAKMVTAYKGFKMLRNSAFKATYKNMWCAGPSCEFVNEIKPVSKIVADLLHEYENTVSNEMERA